MPAALPRMDAGQGSAWSSCRKQRVFFSVAPNPTDADINPVRLFERMLGVFECVVLPCFQIASQLIFHTIQRGGAASVVVKGAETFESLLKEKPGPDTDRFGGYPEECSDARTWFILENELDALQTTKHLCALRFL
jgi:hypothetical protein